MSRLIGLSIAIVAFTWGMSNACFFGRKSRCNSPQLSPTGNQALYHAGVMLRPDCKGGECPVREQSSPKEEIPFTLSVQDTAGEQRPGTGSPPLSGLLPILKNPKAEIPDLSNVKLPPVVLSVPIPPATAASLDSAVARLPILLDALLTLAGIFGGGKLLQWVTPVASGLGRFITALSSLRVTIPSGPETKSAGANPVVPSSTQSRAS